MRYLQKFNERFYYNLDNEIDIFIKSYYDLLLNLKQLIENGSVGLNYYVDNIKSCFTTLLKTFISNFGEKKYNKFKNKIEELKDTINDDIFKLTGLDELIKELNIIDLSEEEKKFTLNKIYNNYSSKLQNNIENIVNLSKSKLQENEDWEIIDGLTFLHSKVSKSDFKDLKYLLQIEFLKLQEWVKNNDKKVLIIFDGRDAAGKGTNIGTITEHLDPKYYRVETFGIPTKDESNNWFKRYENVLPKKGEIVFFDRSWYTRAYVEKPMEYCTDKQYKQFLEEVDLFENKLLNKNIDLIKLWLSINKDVQKYRFELRKSNPLKYWKFSTNDSKILNRWDDFTYYINLIVKKLGKIVKWNVIDSNDERESIINVMRSILSKFTYEHKNKEVVSGDNKILMENKDTNQRPYLFLDIDGVFIPFNNHDSVDHTYFNKPDKWSKEAIKSLNELCNKFNPKIIIISSFRVTRTLQQIKDGLKNAGFIGDVISELPNKKDEKRFQEVSEYIKKNNITNYIIIDDQNHDIEKATNLKTNLCKPSIKTGFTSSDLKKCISILSGNQ